MTRISDLNETPGNDSWLPTVDVALSAGLKEINDSYSCARARVGEMLLSAVKNKLYPRETSKCS